MTHQRALALIFCTATLDILALGIVVQVLAMVLLSLAAGDMTDVTEVLVLFGSIYALAPSGPWFCLVCRRCR